MGDEKSGRKDRGCSAQAEFSGRTFGVEYRLHGLYESATQRLSPTFLDPRLMKWRMTLVTQGIQ